MGNLVDRSVAERRVLTVTRNNEACSLLLCIVILVSFAYDLNSKLCCFTAMLFQSVISLKRLFTGARQILK